ncbi:enoyl-CoA hydratase/isomerase family protein [Caballeronia insecticola]|uniref:Enoyl-CoA hydratase/isomerase n=1 Tax=Caballeronia insecticola TaxID=758793 RepID=R4WSR7_9BURK|nr:enoyl-CoA hydratase-related protein [Caballeronia insecticola]BAN27624.1 enoyl-CoA hydratase/isomerase [Caballeronia insecticola]
MMDARIASELIGQIWTIGLNRPDKRNALDGLMFDALANSLRLAQGDERVRCVLLHGTDESFCSGHDTAAFAALWPQADDGAVRRCIAAFAEQPKPLIAAVNGAAVGFGATMLLHADWVVAGESAIFRFPFSDLGIVPEAGATALLARRIGDLAARDWLMSGRAITASEALQRRFVSRVVPDADVRAVANDYARRLAAKSPNALQTTRRLILDGATLPAKEAIEREFFHLNAFIPACIRRPIPHG